MKPTTGELVSGGIIVGIAYSAQFLAGIIPGQYRWLLPVGTTAAVIGFVLSINYSRINYAKTTEGLRRDIVEERRKNVKATIEQMLQFAANLIKGQSNFQIRSNLALINENNAMKIGFNYNMRNSRETEILFPRGKGCIGCAWDEGHPIYTDLTAPNQHWGLTADETVLTADLKSVLSVPVWNPDNQNDIIGIFSVDSTEPIAVTGFDGQGQIESALSSASLLGNLLRMWNEI